MLAHPLGRGSRGVERRQELFASDQHESRMQEGASRTDKPFLLFFFSFVLVLDSVFIESNCVALHLNRVCLLLKPSAGEPVHRVRDERPDDGHPRHLRFRDLRQQRLRAVLHQLRQRKASAVSAERTLTRDLPFAVDIGRVGKGFDSNAS